MSITINQIAELANVSRATVDKVIHNRPGVKKETRERVQAIIDNLNYKPNFIGKALVLSKKPIKIGIILLPDYNSFIQAMLEGIKKAQAEFSPFGFEIIIKIQSTMEPGELLNILVELESMNISGLALIPLESNEVVAKLNQMQANGISLLTFNSQLKNVQGFCHIGQNHKKAGAVAAGLMEKLLPNGGEIGVIIGTKNFSCHPDRLAGFQTRLSERDNHLTIVEIQENQDKKEEAFRIALDYLHRYPNLNGFYLSSTGSDGVKRALELANISHPVKIICHDLLPETIQLLQEGGLDLVIDQSAKEQGYKIVQLLFNYLIKSLSPPRYYYEIPIHIISREIVLPPN